LGDVSRGTTGRFRQAGSKLAFVGRAPMVAAVGGSVLADVMGVSSRTLPAVDYATFLAACALVRTGIADGAIASARDVSDGGMLVAATEMAFATGDAIGFVFEDDCPLINGAAYSWPTWFGEHVGFVIEVRDAAALMALPGARDLVRVFGATIARPFVEFSLSDAHPVERVSLSALRAAWEAPLRDFYGSAA
jgi:phosphoribosylformylglycinamidine (FGAM) synthase-like enzyme